MIPRNFFPNMPDEVFEMWLDPIAEEYGWPFKSPSDSTKETKWGGVFRGAPLSFWADTTWCRKQINLTTDPINRHSEYLIRTLLHGYTNGVPTLIADVADTEKRVRSCADYIRTYGNIPKPVVAIIRDREIDIVDGYHRITALLHVGPPQIFIVPAWVASMGQ
jgi:hypothetical protein